MQCSLAWGAAEVFWGHPSTVHTGTTMATMVTAHPMNTRNAATDLGCERTFTEGWEEAVWRKTDNNNVHRFNDGNSI